jgi:diaminopimelate epimerase
MPRAEIRSEGKIRFSTTLSKDVNQLWANRRVLAFARECATSIIMLRFTKMNGAGNDFVMLDNRAGNIQLTREQISRICDRHRGVGADGILLLENATNGADFRMRYYNRDGGEAEMCGNGARCFARFANKVAGANGPITFETPAGVIGARLDGDRVTLQMSDPSELRLNVKLQLEGEDATVNVINTGVPHVVVPVSRVDMVGVRERGAAIRYHEMFSPKGTNANFLEKRGSQNIAIRTYERGVEDETLACGTGVVASALVFAAMEKVRGPIGVLVRGGSELAVDFERDGDRFRNVSLSGPAEFVFEGSIEL